MRRTLLSLTTMVVALLLACGVALAANITCPGGPCTGTDENDRITGSQLDDQIQALAGRDVVTARARDDFVDGGRNRDDIFGGPGGDALLGGWGPDDIDGGPSTTSIVIKFSCAISEEAFTDGTQHLWGGHFGFSLAEADGNDDLDGGRDNDLLAGGGGRNDLSGNGGDDIFVVNDGNADAVFGGAGIDWVLADATDRVAADCEQPPQQATGSTPVVEMTITTPEGTTTTAP